MTQELAIQHDRATHSDTVEPKMSLLVQGLFGVMSGVHTIDALAKALGSKKMPDLEPLKRQSALVGATLSFKSFDGGEDLALSIKHNEKANKLIVEVDMPSGLKDREAIASNVRSVLEGATDRNISFRELEKSVGASKSSTDTTPIAYRGEFDVPAGLEQILCKKAPQVLARHEEAKINIEKLIKSGLFSSATKSRSFDSI